MEKHLSETSFPTLSVKGSREWKDWVDKLARFTRLPVSVLIDLALIDYAKKVEFDQDAPKR